MKIDNNGSSKYSPRILKDTLNTKQTQKDNDKSQRKIEYGISNTFYSYCSELISESCIYTFNYVNYKYTIKDFRNFTYKEFLPRFRDVMGRIKLFGYKNVKEFCEKNSGYSFRYGIIDKDLAHLIKNSNYDNDDEIYKIGLCNNNVSLKVSMRRLKIAMNRVKIFDNYVTLPYFFYCTCILWSGYKIVFISCVF